MATVTSIMHVSLMLLSSISMSSLLLWTVQSVVTDLPKYIS
jgi:hypothetical protein